MACYNLVSYSSLIFSRVVLFQILFSSLGNGILQISFCFMDSSSILQDQVESCPLLSSNFWHFVQIFACVPYHLIHPFCFGSKSKMKMIRVQFFRFSNQKSKCQLTVQNESRSACQPCIGPGWGAYGVSAGPPKLVELGSSSVQMSSSQTGSLSFLSKLLKYSVLTQHILKSADSARYWHEIKT